MKPRLEPLRAFPVPPPGTVLQLTDDPVEIDGMRVRVHRTVALYPVQLQPAAPRPSRARDDGDG